MAHANSPFSFNQPANYGAANGVALSDRYSTNGAGPSHITASDNFGLTVDTNANYVLTSVSLSGFVVDALNLVQLSNSAVTGYELNFLQADGFGNPTHTILASRTFTAGDPHVSTAFEAPGTGSNTGLNFYTTTLSLADAPVSFGTGGTFYINFGVSGSSNATYGWAFSGSGSGSSNYLAQNSGGGWGTWTNSPGANLAFQLSGTVESVPEPATFLLGFAVLPFLRRCRK